MPKYKLVKDLPFQKADDTEWELVGEGIYINDQKVCLFKAIGEDTNLPWEMSWGDPLTSGFFEEVKAKRWRGKKNETYYFVRYGFSVVKTYDEYSSVDDLMWEDGNYFRTKDQAEEAAKRIKKLLADYQEEINKE